MKPYSLHAVSGLADVILSGYQPGANAAQGYCLKSRGFKGLNDKKSSSPLTQDSQTRKDAKNNLH